MNPLIWALVALSISVISCCILRFLDPKRRRIQKKPVANVSKIGKVLLWLAVFAPGVFLLTISQPNAFLSWSGGLVVIGWVIAQWPIRFALRGSYKQIGRLSRHKK